MTDSVLDYGYENGNGDAEDPNNEFIVLRTPSFHFDDPDYDGGQPYVPLVSRKWTNNEISYKISPVLSKVLFEIT